MIATTVDISKALSIEGWMTEQELDWLGRAAQGRRVIVELGSFLGRSTAALAANTDGLVYALDDWRGPRDSTEGIAKWRAETNPQASDIFAKFLDNIAGFSNVRPVTCDHNVPPPLASALDMVFIDGSHEYADVRRDIEYWKSRLAPGGLLCGHDYNWDGVYEAVGDLLPMAKPVPGTALWYWQQSPMTTMDVKDVAWRTGLRLPRTGPEAAPAVSGSLPEWKTINKIPKNLAVAIGIASSGRYVPLEWGLALYGLAVPPGTNTTLLPVKGVQRDIAREGIAEKAIEIGARNVLFFDDDNPPPPDTIYKLLSAMDNADEDVAVVAGIYCTKTNPATPLVWLKEGEGCFWRWKAGDIFECEVIATGCMMIRTSALASIAKPWFADVTSPEQARELGLAGSDSIHYEMTDDVFFCRRVREAGFRILAHGGVLPGHWDQDGNVYFLPDDSYPMRPR